MRRSWIALVLSAFLVSSIFAQTTRTEAQTPPDYDLPAAGGAHFYTQANGQGGAGGTGYAVSNADGIPFWDFFQSAGGVDAVGFPVSHRFIWNGFTVQALQKVVFQWRPEAQTVYFVNVLDEMNNRGLNGYLQTVRQVPPPADWSSDSGLPFDQVQSRHLALLTANPAIAQAYYADDDPINHNGLPMAPIQNMGNVLVLRAQRKVYQQWLVNVPWAAAGQVVTANGGDLGKEGGLYPTAATTPVPANVVPLSAVSGSVTPVGPTPLPTVGATATPTATTTPSAQCNGDEQMSFNPSNPVTGQQFIINVTSSRPSGNVGLTGANNPAFIGISSGGRGTIWSWAVTLGSAGQYGYNFTINNVICTANTVTVNNPASTPVPTAAPPTAVPTASPCGGETFSTVPVRPIAGSEFRIYVNAPRASSPQLIGQGLLQNDPYNNNSPWEFRANVGSAGTYTYDFKAAGQLCQTTSIRVDPR